MSDGPHRSLAMRRAWRLVAERADKRSYTVAEITEAIVPALEQDCRTEMSPEFLTGLRRVADEPLLFPDAAAAARFESLRPLAGSGIARSVLDNVSPLAAADLEGWSLICESVKVAIHDRANKGVRQVEEHYLRKENAPRANNVRGRIESGVA